MDHETAYGAYVFLLLHSPEPEADAPVVASLAAIVETGPTPWLYGLPVDILPKARASYLELCERYGVTPEACVRS